MDAVSKMAAGRERGRGGRVPEAARVTDMAAACPLRDQGVRGQPGHGRRQRRAGESLQLLRTAENRVDRQEPAGVRLRGVRRPPGC